MRVRTDTSGISSAEACRVNGWGPGTRLIGDEGHGPTVIEITAVGHRHILAKALAHNGGAVEPHEAEWVLWCRNWREATPDEIPAPFEVGRLVQSQPDGRRGTVVRGPDAAGSYRIDLGNGKHLMTRNPKAVQA